MRAVAIFFMIVFFTCCRNQDEKKLYGTYSIKDSVQILFSRITFFPGNIYSFNSFSCLTSNHDSGEFELNKDTISFTSFNAHSTGFYFGLKPLTGHKLIYSKNKIYYISKRYTPANTVENDTTFWVKEKTP